MSLSPVALAAPRAEVTLDLGPEAFVDHLARVALDHRAVHHPYLQALADGTLPDTRWALADFALQYHAYQRAFPQYLPAGISRLERAEHRLGLLENLTEESGTYEAEELEELAREGIRPEWVEGVPHPVLFQRFSRALGVEPGPEADPVVCWREMFLSILTHGSAAEALGALGLGTENIVSTIYVPFVRAIARVPGLAPEDTVFFPLHTAVDDHHQATLQGIAAAYAGTAQGRWDLRRGMLKALTLRAAFWDWMLERAERCC